MFDLTTEEARLLLKIALMATGANRFQSSERILSALERFRPGHESVQVARAVMLLSALDYTGAVRYIDEIAMPNHPDSGMLRVFKGLALIKLARRDEAMPILSEATESTDPVAARMARDMMQ